MRFMQRLVHAIRPSAGATSPRPGQLIRTLPEDSWRDYPADGITPSRMASILRSADAGALDETMQLYEQMEEKDAHLFSVANTRRLGLTGLDWQVISASEVREGVDRSMADEAAAFCREQLTRLECFDEVLQHLALALGRNIALAELVWESQRSGPVLVDIVPVEFTRIALGELDEPRILTKQEPLKGVALPPNKFIVHTPHSTSGHPSRGGLLRVSALAFLGKQFALKDWLVFGEVFGMPVRIARYEPSATPQEKRELLDMLQSLGSDAAGIFSKAVELEFAEPKVNAGPSPYESICNFLNREMSKAWLGQTLTVETVGQSSAFAAADVHDRVRRDLLEDDIRKEGRTLRRDLLRPLSQLGFGRDVPVPFFRRKLEAPRDMRELVDVLSTAVNRLGLKVPQRWAHDVLGIPEPGDAEDVLEATDASSPVA